MEGRWDDHGAAAGSKRQHGEEDGPSDLDDDERLGHSILSSFLADHAALCAMTSARAAILDRANREAYGVALQSLDLDFYYARLVCGAAVSTNMKMIWVPATADTFDQQDLANAKAVVWEAIGKIMAKYAETNGHDRVVDLVGGNNNLLVEREQQNAESVQRLGTFLKALKTEIESSWAARDRYRVSDQVHMVEVELLRRLHRDGAFPHFQRLQGSHELVLRACFLMRRHPDLRYPFSSAVGKRLFSSKIVATQRAQIMEHKRSSAWAEQEYASLYTYMRGPGSQAFAGLLGQLSSGDAESNVLLHDYMGMLSWYQSVFQEGPANEGEEEDAAEPAAQQQQRQQNAWPAFWRDQ